MDLDDQLDIMIESRRPEEAMLNDSMGNFQPTKTPSTAEHGSMKGHVSFESHANNLIALHSNLHSEANNSINQSNSQNQ